MAARHFAEQRCDLVIWETGLGGRLDATNIVAPLASVITNVDLDHEKWLGETVGKIAAEKAGIIKPGVPVFTAIEHPEALPVLFHAAARNGSPFFLVTWAQARRPPVTDVALPLAGYHQRRNAALASFVAGKLVSQIPVTPAQIRAGLAHAHWPGRFQIVERERKKIVLDGAHNPAGAAALAATLKEKFPGEHHAFILGTLGDKDWSHMIEALAPLASRVWLVPVRSDRSAKPAELLETCRRIHSRAPVETAVSLAEALQRASAEPLVVVAGSLYLIGEALELLGLAPATAHSEHELNEYHPGLTVAGQNLP
jgi:dihydrofolate synthase/folylpolyglutamate synthase